MKSNPQRTRDLAAIHAIKRNLGLDEDLYRDLLEQWTAVNGKPGKRSAGDLNAKERGRVLYELGKLGNQGNANKKAERYPGAPSNLDEVPMLQKIEAQLADMGLPWSYADAIAKRQFRIERVAWLKDRKHFDAVIAALHVEQEKRSLWSGVEREMHRLSITEADIERDYRPRKGWQRHREALDQLINILSEKEA